MHRSLMLIALALCLAGYPTAASAAEKDEKAATKESTSVALPATKLLTLRLEEGGESSSFTMTVASRHFSMSLGEKSIGLRGRLWGPDVETLILDFTLEYTQWTDAQPGKQRTGSTWNGSTYVTEGKPIEIVRFLSGAFWIELTTLE